MKEKKRLFEIYNKINNLQISEDVFDEFNSEEMNELKEQIIDDIQKHFEIKSNEKIFRNGIPNKIRIYIQDVDIIFEMEDENNFKLIESTPEKNKYEAIFVSNLEPINDRLKNINSIITIPVILEIIKNDTGYEINFDTKIWVESDDIEIDFELKN